MHNTSDGPATCGSANELGEHVNKRNNTARLLTAVLVAAVLSIVALVTPSGSGASAQAGSTATRTTAVELGSPELAPAAIMWTTTAYCGTTRGPNGSMRISVGDWGSMELLPSKYSLFPSQMRVGKYYRFQIDSSRYRVYDIQPARYPAYDLNPCRRIGAHI